MDQNSEFQWTDFEFALPVTSILRVQQRSVRNPAELREDLHPYRELEGLWTSRSCANSIMLTGVLAGYSHGEGSDVFDIAASNTRLRREVKGVDARTLTVWRVNNQFDALQVRVSGKSGFVYARVGGNGIIRIFADIAEKHQTRHSGVAAARAMFETRLLPD